MAEAWVAISRNLCPSPEIISAKLRRTTPHLIEEGFRQFNLIAYEGKVFAMAQSLGPTDLASLPTTELKQLCSQEQVYVADTPEEASAGSSSFTNASNLDRVPRIQGIQSGCLPRQDWAVAQALEPLDLTVLSAGDFEEHQRTADLRSSLGRGSQALDRPDLSSPKEPPSFF